MREIINKLAQYDLSAEVIGTCGGLFEVPNVYSAQGFVILDLDKMYKQAILNNQVDIAEILKDE